MTELSKLIRRENIMNCKKYRACLVGLIAVAMICGVLIFVKMSKTDDVPVDGTLVEREMDNGEDGEVWA